MRAAFAGLVEDVGVEAGLVEAEAIGEIGEGRGFDFEVGSIADRGAKKRRNADEDRWHVRLRRGSARS